MQGAGGAGALNDLARIPVAIQQAGYYAHRRSLKPDLLEISIFIRSDCRLSDREKTGGRHAMCVLPFRADHTFALFEDIRRKVWMFRILSLVILYKYSFCEIL